MKDRICIKCGELKTIDNYYLLNRSWGIQYYTECKPCVLKRTKLYGIANSKEIHKKVVIRNKSINGVLRSIYQGQKTSVDRGRVEYLNYSFIELKEWILSQPNFKLLYENWLNSGCVKMQKPSVDRLDDYRGYSLDNIQLMTWQENKDKYHMDAKNGINNKKGKAVVQLDLDGILIREFHSMKNACRITGIDDGNIGKVCKGKYSQINGFKWMYAEDYYGN